MKSTYGAAMTVTFMNAWNNYLWPTIIYTGQQGDHHADVSSQSEEWIQCGLWYADAGVLICTLPTAIIFLCLQKSFANGITGSSEIMQQKMPKQETMTQAHIRKASGSLPLAHRMA